MTKIIQEDGSKFKLLDIFSGIGGFSLGLERSGYFRTVAFCEIEPFPRRVLKKHWPDVPIYEDVRTLTADALRRDGIRVDAICGGFPCQDASIANILGRGTEGERTGLFREAVRLTRDLRPLVLIMENVTNLLIRGIGDVLGALAAIGYDTEWRPISARRGGADHARLRTWFLAYPSGQRWKGLEPNDSILERAAQALPKHGHQAFGEWRSLVGGERPLRGFDGVSVAMERRRLKAIGNAVVPQIPELIGRAIGEAMAHG
jgi:DNA (cytosine-5)-methyltransferase 1